MNIKSKLRFTALAVCATLIACNGDKNTEQKNYAENKTNKPLEVPLKLEDKWDKVFKKSELITHKKVTFTNNFGITLAADMYIPKDTSLKINGKFPAIAVSGPFGAVKEQSSGLYAQQMAEKGFLTIAFDPSFTGESSGEPRRIASPDINTEDFLAAIDFLSADKNVDENRLGIIGICGWGGIALNAAATDTRIKATVASTMYDMTRVNGNGYFDASDNEEARYETRKALSAQRLKDYNSKSFKRAGGVVDPLPQDAPEFVKDYYAYYKTPRGYHVRSGNSTDGWNVTGTISYFNSRFLRYTNEIRSAVLVIHGEKAHSRYFGEDAYKYMVFGDSLKGIAENAYKKNKELLIIQGANHTDLYDNLEKIPFNKLEAFFKEYLK